MSITMLKGKIHRATVTQAKLDYVGSITIDEALMEAVGILEYERVEIACVETGERFATYVIAGVRNSGVICLNGAAARCAQVGDHVIILAYEQLGADEAKAHRPQVVFVDGDNAAVRVTRYERHGELGA